MYNNFHLLPLDVYKRQVGYQPTLATEMGELQERIASTKNGSVTSVQAVYVPADDLTDPAPATTFAHLDATTVLSRKIVEQGIYPAVDPLESTSRILEADVVGQEHYEVARKVQEYLQKYKELQDIIAILGMEELCLLYTSSLYFDVFDGLIQTYVFVFLTSLFIKEQIED